MSFFWSVCISANLPRCRSIYSARGCGGIRRSGADVRLWLDAGIFSTGDREDGRSLRLHGGVRHHVDAATRRRDLQVTTREKRQFRLIMQADILVVVDVLHLMPRLCRSFSTLWRLPTGVEIATRFDPEPSPAAWKTLWPAVRL